MTSDPAFSPAAGRRGPAEHVIRQQIVDAANAHFSRFGYGKTTVADLAKAIGFSKAYIYKFFDSKQAIGEAICAQCLEKVLATTEVDLAEGRSATEKFRRLFRTIIEMSTELFFQDKMLYDIAASAVAEGWAPSAAYRDRIADLLREIILLGRESGEFERKTPIDETCEAIMLVMEGFLNPLMLQLRLATLPEAPPKVINLILRSLAP
jgi:AcrR family transcriptional regulator